MIMKCAVAFSFCISFFQFTSYAQTDQLINSGKTKQKANNHEGAIYDFSSAIKQNEAEVQKYLKLLEEYDKIPAFEKAEKGMEAPPIDVKFAMPYYLRGCSYSVSGKNDNAINDFTTAAKINPKMGAAFYERGKLLWTMGKKDAGCTDIGMAASLKDSLAREMFDEKFCWKEAVAAAKEASLRLKMSEFQPALDEIEKAIKLCPDSARYFGIRGRAYLGLGKHDLAMFDFDKAISLGKNSIDAWFGRGVAYYNKNKWQEAFDDLSKAIQLDEKFADAYLFRAYSCEGMQKNQSALFDYQQVEKLNPGSGLAYFKSGLLKSEMNDAAGACNDFRKAAALSWSEAQDYADKCDKQVKRK